MDRNGPITGQHNTLGALRQNAANSGQRARAPQSNRITPLWILTEAGCRPSRVRRLKLHRRFRPG